MDILSGFLIIPTDYIGLCAFRIRPVTAPDEFTEIVEVVVEESEIEEGYVKIIVTRGVMTITSRSLQEVRFNRMSLYMGSLLI